MPRRKPTKKWQVAEITDVEVPDTTIPIYYDTVAKRFWFRIGQTVIERSDDGHTRRSEQVGSEIEIEHDTQAAAEAEAKSYLESMRGLDWQVFIEVRSASPFQSRDAVSASIEFKVHAVAKSYGDKVVRCHVPKQYEVPWLQYARPDDFGRFIAFASYQGRQMFDAIEGDADIEANTHVRYLRWSQEAMDSLVALRAALLHAKSQIADLMQTPAIGDALASFAAPMAPPQIEGPVDD